MESRPAIPMAIKRKILMEAGHRCAIPTCKQTPVELAHIVPWSTVKEHTFENLIALCPTCHTRFDRGDIDKKSIEQYKLNLNIINNKYGDFERRVLEFFAENTQENQLWLPGGLDIMLMYLLKDNLIIDTGETSKIIMAGMPSQKLYELTTDGRLYVNEWLKGHAIT